VTCARPPPATWRRVGHEWHTHVQVGRAGGTSPSCWTPLTRLARAYTCGDPCRRTLSGRTGSSRALPAKKVLLRGAYIERRRLADHCGPCLVDTGSRMDDVVYEDSRHRQIWSSTVAQAAGAPGFSRFRHRALVHPPEELLSRPGYHPPRVLADAAACGQMITPPPKRGRHGPVPTPPKDPRSTAPDRDNNMEFLETLGKNGAGGGARPAQVLCPLDRPSDGPVMIRALLSTFNKVLTGLHIIGGIRPICVPP